MSPSNVVPNRKLSSNPVRMSASVCSGVTFRRCRITASQPIGELRRRRTFSAQSAQVQVGVGVDKARHDGDIAEVGVGGADAVRLDGDDLISRDGDGAAFQRWAVHREDPPSGQGAGIEVHEESISAAPKLSKKNAVPESSWARITWLDQVLMPALNFLPPTIRAGYANAYELGNVHCLQLPRLSAPDAPNRMRYCGLFPSTPMPRG